MILITFIRDNDTLAAMLALANSLFGGIVPGVRLQGFLQQIFYWTSTAGAACPVQGLTIKINLNIL